MKPKAQVEYRELTDLKELPGNPRTIKKDQFEKLKKSIQDNQDYFEARPLILSDRTGELVILAGNQRYKAAKAIGMKEVPTILLPNLTEEREKEIIIRDNIATSHSLISSQTSRKFANHIKTQTTNASRKELLEGRQVRNSMIGGTSIKSKTQALKKLNTLAKCRSKS